MIFTPLYLASSGGRTLVSNGKVVFENESAVAALDVLRRGFAEGTLPRSNFALGRDPFIDGTVASLVLRRKIPRVHRIVTRRAERRHQRRRQMRIHDELHDNARCWLRAASVCPANSRHASKSSRSRSGNSCSTSSIVSPPARYSSIDSTG